MEKQLTIHEFKYFYPADFMEVPEFCFENKIEQGTLKPKEEQAIVEYLNAKEEAEEKKKADEEAAAVANAAGGVAAAKGKADPKKDAKGGKGAAKGAAAADDKNAP